MLISLEADLQDLGMCSFFQCFIHYWALTKTLTIKSLEFVSSVDPSISRSSYNQGYNTHKLLKSNLRVVYFFKHR
jgi:hypothetical protein